MTCGPRRPLGWPPPPPPPLAPPLLLLPPPPAKLELAARPLSPLPIPRVVTVAFAPPRPRAALPRSGLGLGLPASGSEPAPARRHRTDETSWKSQKRASPSSDPHAICNCHARFCGNHKGHRNRARNLAAVSFCIAPYHAPPQFVCLRGGVAMALPLSHASLQKQTGAIRMDARTQAHTHALAAAAICCPVTRHSPPVIISSHSSTRPDSSRRIWHIGVRGGVWSSS
jgi:hypothetical protein